LQQSRSARSDCPTPPLRNGRRTLIGAPAESPPRGCFRSIPIIWRTAATSPQSMRLRKSSAGRRPAAARCFQRLCLSRNRGPASGPLSAQRRDGRKHEGTVLLVAESRAEVPACRIAALRRQTHVGVVGAAAWPAAHGGKPANDPDVAIAMARREPAPKVKAIAGVNASRLVLRHFARQSRADFSGLPNAVAPGSYRARCWCTPGAAIIGLVNASGSERFVGRALASRAPRKLRSSRTAGPRA
jgi:hypothetical protein